MLGSKSPIQHISTLLRIKEPFKTTTFLTVWSFLLCSTSKDSFPGQQKLFRDKTTPEQGLSPATRPQRGECSSERSPVNGLLPGFLEQLIGLGEMPTAKEASVDREGRGMHRLQDVVAFLGSTRGNHSLDSCFQLLGQGWLLPL